MDIKIHTYPSTTNKTQLVQYIDDPKIHYCYLCGQLTQTAIESVRMDSFGTVTELWLCPGCGIDIMNLVLTVLSPIARKLFVADLTDKNPPD